MNDYEKMSNDQLEELSLHLQQEEFQIMKELLRRNQSVNFLDSDVQPADMKPTEEDF
jgi:hypothetical protein